METTLRATEAFVHLTEAGLTAFLIGWATYLLIVAWGSP